MSHCRVIKPRAYIPRPKAFIKEQEAIVIGGQNQTSKDLTQIADIDQFEKCLDKCGVKSAKKGKVGNVDADYKINDNIGFKKEKDKLYVIRTRSASKADEILLKRISNEYLMEETKKILKEEGYNVSEDSNEVKAKKNIDGIEREIEISKQLSDTDHDKDQLEIESVNFDDHDECKDAVDTISKQIQEEIKSENNTENVKGKKRRQKQKTRDNKRQRVLKTSDRSKRKLQG